MILGLDMTNRLRFWGNACVAMAGALFATAVLAADPELEKYKAAEKLGKALSLIHI